MSVLEYSITKTLAVIFLKSLFKDVLKPAFQENLSQQLKEMQVHSYSHSHERSVNTHFYKALAKHFYRFKHVTSGTTFTCLSNCYILRTHVARAI